MFLKQLKIESDSRLIRKIDFRKGINLIVDESKKQVTGNNVGKTTVLKLINFCLGGDSKEIYTDPETKTEEYTLVKDFLIDGKVLITLVLAENLDEDDSKTIIVERNFLSGDEGMRRVNGKDLTHEEFPEYLKRQIFPSHKSEKPSLKQIVSHNIRYKDLSINNTLKTLNRYTTNAEYETLYLFLLGMHFDEGKKRQEILNKIRLETNYKNRLESNQTRTAYETALSLVEDEIDKLNDQKSNLNINENFEKDLKSLDKVKYQINQVSAEVSNLNIRKNLIDEAKEDFESNKAQIDTQQLERIYSQASDQISKLHKTFDQLVAYHNKMSDEKIRFITKELPELEQQIKEKESHLNRLLEKEKELSSLISKSDSYDELEKVIVSLTDQFKLKGEYEKMIKQIGEAEGNLTNYNDDLDKIDEGLFSEEFQSKLQKKINTFNKYFSDVSNKLYGEKYALKYDIKVDKKKNRKIYVFSAFNLNLSSGKKQGEISCFDIAYILYAEAQNMEHVNFLLNDKKELMHDNQLVKIADLVEDARIQFVASILKDKLPDELNKEDYFILKLSQDNKLFKIESFSKENSS